MAPLLPHPTGEHNGRRQDRFGRVGAGATIVIVLRDDVGAAAAADRHGVRWEPSL